MTRRYPKESHKTKYRKKQYPARKSSRKRENPLKNYLKWFVFYGAIIFILYFLFKDTNIYQNKIGFYIISGFLLEILGRIFYSSLNKRAFKLKGVLIWGIIYTAVFGILSTLLGKAKNLNPYISLLILSAIFTLVIIFVRRMKIQRRRNRKMGLFSRTPSQIFSGIAALVIGILFFRLSEIIFLNWFNWPEGVAWSWLIGVGFIIGGVLTLKAWWKNNVLQKTIGIKIGNWKQTP